MLKSQVLISIFIFLFATTGYASPNKQIKIETNLGNMYLELNDKQAKNTVGNFVNYMNEGYYNGTIFHRVINNFMIQGGGFELGKKGQHVKKSTKAPIKNEGKANFEFKKADTDVINKKGTISMARTNDPHSATSQFFINHKDNAFLDYYNKSELKDPKNKSKFKKDMNWGYTVFGGFIQNDDKLLKESNATLEKIATTKTQNEKPLKPVIIKKISFLNSDKNKKPLK